MKKYMLVLFSILILVGCSKKTSMEEEYNSFIKEAEDNGYVMEIKSDQSITTITVDGEKYNVYQELDDVTLAYYCGYDTYDVGDAVDLTSNKICDDNLYESALEDIEKTIAETVFPESDNDIKYKKSNGYYAFGKYSSGNDFSLKLNEKLIFDDGKNVVTISLIK